jgi:membrane protease YdiL (CAAX protease family)
VRQTVRQLWDEIRATLGEFWRVLISREGLVICFFILLVCTRWVVYRSDWLGPLLETFHELGGRRAVRVRVTSVLFFGLLPLLLILGVHRENPLRGWGLGLPPKRWIYFTLAFFAVQLMCIPLCAEIPSIAGYYPMLKVARTPGPVFWQWEALMLAAMVSWEFLVRGYLLFGLKERFGIWAVFIQNIPFVVLHFGKPPVELYFSFFDGLGLGLLAYAAGRIWPAVFLHGLGAFALDWWLVYGPGG